MFGKRRRQLEELQREVARLRKERETKFWITVVSGVITWVGSYFVSEDAAISSVVSIGVMVSEIIIFASDQS
jgi:hypothetical protein